MTLRPQYFLTAIQEIRHGASDVGKKTPAQKARSVLLLDEVAVAGPAKERALAGLLMGVKPLPQPLVKLSVWCKQPQPQPQWAVQCT